MTAALEGFDAAALADMPVGTVITAGDRALRRCDLGEFDARWTVTCSLDDLDDERAAEFIAELSGPVRVLSPDEGDEPSAKVTEAILTLAAAARDAERLRDASAAGFDRAWPGFARLLRLAETGPTS